MASGFFFLIKKSIYFWLYWVFAAVWAFLQLWLVGATLQLRCSGFSLWQFLLLQSMGSRVVQASVVAAHGLSGCGSQALDHRLSSCGVQVQCLHGTWDLSRPGIEPMSPAFNLQADSLPLSHQGSSIVVLFKYVYKFTSTSFSKAPLLIELFFFFFLQDDFKHLLFRGRRRLFGEGIVQQKQISGRSVYHLSGWSITKRLLCQKTESLVIVFSEIKMIH